MSKVRTAPETVGGGSGAAQVHKVILTIGQVLISTLLVQSGLGLLTPLIPLLLLQQGASTILIGAVASAYYMGFLAGAVFTPHLISRVGHTRALVVFMSLASCAAIFLDVTNQAWLWGMLRVVIGINIAGALTIFESWLNHETHLSTRGRVYSVYLLLSSVGGVVGAQILVWNRLEASWFLAASLAFSISVLPIVLAGRIDPPKLSFKPLHLSAVYRLSKLGFFGVLASGLISGGFYSLCPVFLKHYGYNSHRVAEFTALTILAGLLAQYPIGMLSDRFGRWSVAVVSLVIAFCAVLGMGVTASLSWHGLVLASGIMIGMTMPLYGVGASHANDQIDQPMGVVAVSSGLLFIWAFGACAGPWIAGLAMTAFGALGFVFYLAGIIGIVGIFLGAHLRTTRAFYKYGQGGLAKRR